jgi:uncharacterized protein
VGRGRSRVLAGLASVLAFLVLGLILGLGASTARAYEPPKIRGHVNDTAGVLSSSQVRELESELTRVRQQDGYHLVLLIVPSLGDESIEDVAYDTFNTWGVGEAGLDNGVLLVLAVAEQRVRIETGKGVGGELTDIESGRIIREQIKPLVVEGQWYAASWTGMQAIAEALTGVAGPRGPPRSGPGERGPSELTLVHKILIGVGILILVILAIVFPGFREVLFWVLWAMLRRGGGGRHGGGGGGGYSGGGGRSGGGGASG